MERRDFLTKSALAAAAVASTAISGCESLADKHNKELISDKKFEWRCVTIWPPNFPVLGESVVKIAKEIEIMSAGRLKIHVYGAGELVPALETFDAVSLGAVQMAHGAAYYWTGKMPSSVFFTAIPFGMNAQQMNSWLFFGGGWELWKEAYRPFGLLPFPCGNTGVQMGGWFNKEIKSIDDLKGTKMRIPGFGGKVMERAGVTAVTMAGGEIYTNLERGVIDAAEWISPYHDYLMGFHRIAKYYYYPGWQEPGPVLELICNQKAYDELPPDLQEIVTAVALKYNTLMLAEFEAKNNFYLKKILTETQVQLKQFPEEVLIALKKYTQEVTEKLIESDPFTKKVHESYTAFKQEIVNWSRISEQTMTKFS